MRSLVIKLITHVTPLATAGTVKTIAAYAGEIQDVKKLSTAAPAIYLVAMESTPHAFTATAQIDMLIVSKTALDKYNKPQQSAANLDLPEAVSDYLAQNRLVNSEWEIDLERLTIKTLAITPQYTVSVINLYLTNLTFA